MGRIALLSDIHGNLIALEAVLADIAALGGVDQIWVLGDLVAIGPQPIEVLDRLYELTDIYAIRGNTDRYIVTGARPYPSQNDVLAKPNLLSRLIEVERSFAWTQGAITTCGWMSYLEALSLERRLVLPDGTRLLAVHAAPGTDDGDGIHPQLTEAELRILLQGCEADLVCVGHTHWPVDFHLGNVHVINLGSVSNPRIPSLDASYVLLEAEQSGYRVQHRQVAYDREAVIALLVDLRHPGADFISGYLRGGHVPSWGDPPSTLWREA